MDQDIKFFALTDDLDKVYENLMTFKVDMAFCAWEAKARFNQPEYRVLG